MKQMTTRNPLLAACSIFIGLLLLAGCGSGAGKADSIENDLAIIVTVGNGSLTSLELLEQNHSVEFRKSAMGAMVTAIDSLESGSGAFWLYSVNDTMPTVAADNFVPAVGDTVRWHFRASN